MNYKVYWILFFIVSSALLAGYAVGDQRADHGDPGLKGLTPLQHFGVHYAVGMFFGLVTVLAYFSITKKRSNEPLILLLSVLWSHWPDIRYVYRGGLPHDTWEVIFFFHTIVYESFGLFWIILVLDILLITVYRLVVIKAPPNPAL